MKWYLIIIGVAIASISINILPIYHSIFTAFRYAAFQVASIITTTGFATADYATWPMFSQIILVILTFVGACAGSTGGGIQISRILILVKNAFAEIRRMVHPHSVVSIDFEN